MHTVDFNVSYSDPVVSFTFESDDPQVIKALYHRLNIGSRRMVNAKKIQNGRAAGPKYGDEYGVDAADVSAKLPPLAELADYLEDVVDSL